jgi:succinyl-diaminopimelate desuccinylase
VIDELLQRTAFLVDIASESLHEGKIADFIIAQLEDVAGLTVERIGDNVVARTQSGCAQRIIFAGHTDTVPIKKNVPSHREGNRLWGCGTSDMKSGIAVMIKLAQEVSESNYDRTFVFYVAEEIAAAHSGLGYLFEHRPELLKGDVAFLGEPTNGHIEAGCQGTLRVRVGFAGKAAHSARPWMGVNAMYRMAPVLQRFADYAPRRPLIDGCQFREAMQVVCVGGGKEGNVVPDQAFLTVNYRFAPDRSIEQAIEEVHSLVISDISDDDTFEVKDVSPAALPGISHPIMQRFIEKNSFTIEAKLGWTDVARFASHGIPAINFGPGDSTMAHRQDEFVDGEKIVETYQALARFLTE